MSEACPPDLRENPIFKRIWRNIYAKKMNQIILFNGLPRTGKSEACLDFAWALDRGSQKEGYPHRFSIENVKWRYRDYLSLVKERNKIGENLIWEEAGTIEGANARQFFTESNISASSLFQTLGWKRQIALINLPCKIMLDKHIRLLVHAIIDTIEVNPEKEYCRAKFYWSKYNPHKDVQFRQQHVYFDQFGILRKITEIHIPRAPEDIRKQFVKLEDKFKRALQARLDKNAERADIQIEQESLTKHSKVEKICKAIEKSLKRYWNPARNCLRQGLIQLDFNVSRNTAYMIKDQLEPKIARGGLKI